jgi:hypothetical protein
MYSDFSKFTGLEFGMEYLLTAAKWDEEDCKRYCSRTKEAFAAYTKAWTDHHNSEWITKNYLALKMILSASVMLTSFEYCQRKNVRIVQPYLLYYATLSCCRAVCFTRPDSQLQSPDFYQMSHSKIINVTSQHLDAIFPSYAGTYKPFLLHLRDDREMFSYKFPATGTARAQTEKNFDAVVDLCSLLAENAQLNSECLEASINRNVVGNYSFNPEVAEKCFLYETPSKRFVDEDDAYRIAYIARRDPKPYNLLRMATEGLLDDFFGSWAPEADEGDPYNPDQEWRVLLPFR